MYSILLNVVLSLTWSGVKSLPVPMSAIPKLGQAAIDSDGFIVKDDFIENDIQNDADVKKVAEAVGSSEQDGSLANRGIDLVQPENVSSPASVSHESVAMIAKQGVIDRMRATVGSPESVVMVVSENLPPVVSENPPSEGAGQTLQSDSESESEVSPAVQGSAYINASVTAQPLDTGDTQSMTGSPLSVTNAPMQLEVTQEGHAVPRLEPNSVHMRSKPLPQDQSEALPDQVRAAGEVGAPLFVVAAEPPFQQGTTLAPSEPKPHISFNSSGLGFLTDQLLHSAQNKLELTGCILAVLLMFCILVPVLQSEFFPGPRQRRFSTRAENIFSGSDSASTSIRPAPRSRSVRSERSTIPVRSTESLRSARSPTISERFTSAKMQNEGSEAEEWPPTFSD